MCIRDSSKAVSNRTTLPVLKGILLEAKNDGKLVMSASDLEISIRKEIDAEIIEAGSTVVGSKLFSDIVRKLPNEEISVCLLYTSIIYHHNFFYYRFRISSQKK